MGKRRKFIPDDGAGITQDGHGRLFLVNVDGISVRFRLDRYATTAARSIRGAQSKRAPA
jgi:hypothetical protein